MSTYLDGHNATGQTVGAAPLQMVYISFGPAAHEEINAEVASRMLTIFKQRDPAHFGALLAEAFTDVAPRRARGERKAGQ